MPLTEPRAKSGKPKPPRRPAFAAASFRGKFVSWITSAIQADFFEANTLPGKPIPFRNGMGARDRFELGEPGRARTPRCFTTQHLLFLTVQPDGTENPIPARGNRLDDL